MQLSIAIERYNFVNRLNVHTAIEAIYTSHAQVAMAANVVNLFRKSQNKGLVLPPHDPIFRLKTNVERLGYNCPSPHSILGAYSHNEMTNFEGIVYKSMCQN